MSYKLLAAFESLFSGVQYRHRRSNQGDFVASYLLDDVYSLNRSAKLTKAVDAEDLVLNVANKTVGLKHRRGDGTFGTIVPGTNALHVSTYNVCVGEVANIHLGAEVKIMAKAMIKQLDRVGSDMENQSAEFKRHGNSPICVGIIGVNYAASYTSVEGKTLWPTDGKLYAHPAQEAKIAEDRLTSRVQSKFDEVLLLRFVATNTPPYVFKWLDAKATNKQYGASLVRIAERLEHKL